MNRRITILTLALSLLAMTSGCAGDTDSKPGDSSSGQSTSSSPRTSIPTSAPLRVESDGSLVAAYAAPTLIAFAHDDFVTGVVVGEVVAARTEVLADANVVTRIQVRTDGANPTTVTIRQSGGTVTLSQVRADFEGHLTDEQIEKQRDDLVEYVGVTPVNKVGDHVLVLTAGTADDPGGVFAAATLVRGIDGSFGWASEAPNPAWESRIGSTAVTALVRAAARN